jgi:hypothetical protein
VEAVIREIMMRLRLRLFIVSTDYTDYGDTDRPV